MSLPLVLAGPILRRVEPNLVSVWFALSRAASVTLTLWQGRTKFSAVDHLIRSDPATGTLRFGERLHIVQALLRIPKESEKTLKPGVVYSYDVEITETEGGAKHTLASLGLLKTAPTRNGGDAAVPEKPHLALGYDADFLPSFALPPATLEDLRIVYGSCRRPVNEHDDAMALIDDLMRDGDTFADALKRPHQLVLGGDQIYADDLWPLQLHLVNRLANQLIGVADDPGKQHGEHGKPIEHVEVDQVEQLLSGADEDPVTHPDRYKPIPGAAQLPVGLAEFPAGRRRPMILRSAQMTTSDGDSHLISFGEFAALYLMVWCNACWPLADEWPKLEGMIAEFDNPPLRPDVGLFDEPREDLTALDPIGLDKRRLRHARGVERMTDFVKGLPKVRRLLANVPTYMIFDDHDVTDDWNLNPTWYDRVYSTALGRAIVRNALTAYAVFQDWGNDPLRYENERDEPGEKRDRKLLLDTIAQMFPKGATAGPSSSVVDTLDALLGLNQRPAPRDDGGYDAVAPRIKWHFSVGGPRHLLIALDNRTRRSFLSRTGPPGNVPINVQAEQIPPSLGDGRELLVVVGPLQVLGPALLDELIAPASYRVFDAATYSKINDLSDEKIAKTLGMTVETLNDMPDEEREEQIKKYLELIKKHRVGTRGMSGTHPDAIEAWAFDPLVLEALLARLAAHRRVVLLSGDVHYSAGNAMSYWTKGRADPARLVQFTGSGFKNVMPWYIGAVDRVLSIAQRFVRSEVGAERMGWNESDEAAFVLPAGSDLGDTSPALRKKLAHSPMLVPTFGFPAGTTVAPDKLPDWSWRLVPLIDQRPDGERPKAGRPRPLAPNDEHIESVLTTGANSGAELAAYQSVAQRHQDQFDRMRHSRQILFRSNFGLVRFERDAAGAPLAVQELYSALRDPDEPVELDPPPLPFVVQRASLAPITGELPPELSPFRPPAW
ncbi:MAG: hypothetical protein ACREV0_08580 [Burkholderiales bacterium]